jgi:SNF2 family DNA or RNA helicase
VDKFSFTVMKKDCLDLPPKQFEMRTVLMTEAQEKLYNAAQENFIVWLGDERVTIAHAFTRLTRLRQILGGFIKLDDDEDGECTPIPGANPKIESMLQYVEEMPRDKKLVVWSPFTAELNAIADALGRKECAVYWGEVKKNVRHENIDRFQNDPKIRYFVGNPQSGKFGIELFAASHVLYYSNSFSADARWQSEDRVHRIGQVAESVLYTDLTIPNSMDTKIIALLAAHTTMANLFKGDKEAMASWLRTQDPADLDERWAEERRNAQ